MGFYLYEMMDALTDVGVNPDDLKQFSEDDLRTLRMDLFASAKASGLVHPKDILVKCLKRAIGPSLADKYATDISDLCYALRNKELIPRTLLKNGKRSAATLLHQELEMLRIAIQMVMGECSI